MDSLKKAAAHLPRVDAIGGSAAGVYVNNRVKAGSLFRGVPAGPVRGARQGPLPRHPQGVERRAVRGRERRRGHGAGRLDVARRERDSRHRARHQHGGRLCHPRRQHHLVAERARLRAGRLQPGCAGRRMVGRLRRRLAVFLAAGGRPADAGRRHRPAAGLRHMGLARAAEAGAGAEEPGRRRARSGSTRPSACISATASRTSRPSTISATCWCSAASPPAPAATTSSTAHARCSTSSSPSSRRASRSMCPTNTKSATARPLPPPACRRSRSALMTTMTPYHDYVVGAGAARSRGQVAAARRLSHPAPSARRRGCTRGADLLAASGRRVHHRRRWRCGCSARAGFAWSNVAVTQGSNKARQAARLEELRAACDYLGFDLVETVPGGLEKINVKTRADGSGNLAGRGRRDRANPSRPSAPGRLLPARRRLEQHATSAPTTCSMDALARQDAAFRCTSSRPSSGARWRRPT